MTNRLVFVLYRRPHLSRQEFQHYWSTVHAPIVAEVADVLGVIRYHQVHTVEDGPSWSAPPFDGVAELWFAPSRASGSEQSRARARLLEDEQTFIDLPASPLFSGEEMPRSGGPLEGVRITAAVYRKSGTTRAEFRRAWDEGRSATSGTRSSGIGRWVQVSAPDTAETWPPAVDRHAPAACDVVEEIHVSDFGDGEGVRARIVSDLARDTRRLADPERTAVTYGRVDVMIGD